MPLIFLPQTNNELLYFTECFMLNNCQWASWVLVKCETMINT